MPIAERLISMVAQWAKGAQTNIPTPPVPGIAYRNADLTAADIEGGQHYDKVYDSARYNQVDYLTTGLVQGVEQYGILPWSSLTNYPASGICMGLDGIIYQAMQASGPANGGAQPTSNSVYWKEYAPSNVLTLDYFLCTKIFKSIHPTAKPGMVPVNGTLIADAATRYPKAFAYLQTPEGQLLCTTEANWQASNVAVWATLADGTQIGWDNVGGVCKYVIDTNAGSIRVPDLRGMNEEVAGYGSLGVGDVHGDQLQRHRHNFRINNTEGLGLNAGLYTGGAQVYAPVGTLNNADNVANAHYIGGIAPVDGVSVGDRTRVRSWISMACVYLGLPVS